MLVDDKTSVIYIIMTLFLLGGCANSNHYNKYYDKPSCSMHSTFIPYMFTDLKVNEQRHNKKIFTYNHKYNNTNYGSYCHAMYTVKPGDTLFYIAWITGNNYLTIAKRNNVKNVNFLPVGQVLRVNNNEILSFYPDKFLRKILFILKKNRCAIKKILFLNVNKNLLYNSSSNKKSNSISSCPEIPKKTLFNDRWHWPTIGKIINTFSDTERGNKGIDISGVFGQPVLATTNGKVVYVGNTLRGYGNLIIIQHEDNYLSAYAHNDRILVTEQQKVKIGDKIATMGDSGTNEVKLHFEIRHEGKSVNPLYFLPKIQLN